MAAHIDSMPDDDSIRAVMYGPLVLAGRFEAVTTEMTYSGYGPKAGTESKTPEIVVDPVHPTAWVEADAKEPLMFHAVQQSQPLTLVPLNQVIHERYAVYWKVRNKSPEKA
jgi:uncharacterized protein